MIRWGRLDIAETLEELVQPSHTALLMWDYTERVTSKAFNRPEFLAASARLIAAARAASVPIFYTKRSEMSWEDVGAGWIRMRMKIAGIRTQAALGPYDPKTDLFVSETAPTPGDIVVEKFSTNGFLGTNLAWLLRARGIKTIVVTGVASETGVDLTAREAINQGFYSVIARDAVSSHSKARHEAALGIMEKIHDVYDSKEIMSVWARR